MNNKKQIVITVVIIALLIVICTIAIGVMTTRLKNQKIAYEQYKTEDLRQARIYNSTLADNEEKFNEKIKDFSETDQLIAKALYEKKPEIDNIKQQIKEDKKKKDDLNEMNGTDGYNAENDIAEVDNKIKENENKLESIKTTLNETIKDKAVSLEYQETINTNGIKTAVDYITAI